ncbi:hypothetical protein DL771_009924 [Monosporascus sp. 5C6A]|nr:hypothetical protein DL771_009924 [Monosporascus sp. 5C6A]
MDSVDLRAFYANLASDQESSVRIFPNPDDAAQYVGVTWRDCLGFAPVVATSRRRARGCASSRGVCDTRFAFGAAMRADVHGRGNFHLRVHGGEAQAGHRETKAKGKDSVKGEEKEKKAGKAEGSGMAKEEEGGR